MKLPIRLNTEYGAIQFQILNDQFIFYKKNNQLEDFKSRCKGDLIVQDNYLQYFLDDDIMSKKYKMDDVDAEGWKLFNMQSDICSVLKYFSEKIY